MSRYGLLYTQFTQCVGKKIKQFVPIKDFYGSIRELQNVFQRTRCVFLFVLEEKKSILCDIENKNSFRWDLNHGAMTFVSNSPTKLVDLFSGVTLGPGARG